MPCKAHTLGPRRKLRGSLSPICPQANRRFAWAVSGLYQFVFYPQVPVCTFSSYGTPFIRAKGPHSRSHPAAGPEGGCRLREQARLPPEAPMGLPEVQQPVNVRDQLSALLGVLGTACVLPSWSVGGTRGRSRSLCSSVAGVPARPLVGISGAMTLAVSSSSGLWPPGAIQTFRTSAESINPKLRVMTPWPWHFFRLFSCFVSTKSLLLFVFSS